MKTTPLAAALLLLAGADAAIPAGGIPKVSPHSTVSSFQFPVSTFPVPISPGSDAYASPASLPIGLPLGALSRHRHEVPSFHHHHSPIQSFIPPPPEPKNTLFRLHFALFSSISISFFAARARWCIVDPLKKDLTTPQCILPAL